MEMRHSYNKREKTYDKEEVGGGGGGVRLGRAILYAYHLFHF